MTAGVHQMLRVAFKPIWWYGVPPSGEVSSLDFCGCALMYAQNKERFDPPRSQISAEEFRISGNPYACVGFLLSLFTVHSLSPHFRS